MDNILTLVATTMAIFVPLLQLKYQGDEKTPFNKHPMFMRVSVTALLIHFLLVGIIKLKYLRLYETYLRFSPLDVEFFGFLSIAGTVSLLFPDSTQLFVFFLCLFPPALRILYWVFKKLDDEFGETEFWRTRVDPAFRSLKRWTNRAFRPILPR